MRWLLLAAALAILPVLGAHAQDGQRAHDAGRFAEARRLWTPQAEAGDPQAQFGLAVLLDSGRGGPMDRDAARSLFRRAAEAGHAAAQFQVGQAHETGRDEPRDPTQAGVWFARAAARGFAPAALHLAGLYAAGNGVPHNPDVAEAWLRIAADAGLAPAASRLAELRRRTRSAPGGDTPLPASPVFPVDGADLSPRGDPMLAELVWTAPAQRTPVRFFVEVVTVADGVARDVFAQYVDASAVLVPLEPLPREYAWRVYAVGLGAPEYAVSAWTRFRVAAGS